MQKKICPNCEKEFICLNSKDCFCAKYKISEENLKLIENNFKGCLCENCLKEFV